LGFSLKEAKRREKMRGSKAERKRKSDASPVEFCRRSVEGGNLWNFLADLLKIIKLRVIFPREGRLWNFGGTHKIHKRFLTESTGSTWFGKEQRDNVETVHTHLF